MKRLIIFPDIHGRKFWKEPFEKYKDNEDIGFIFLGDYLDAYGFEGISNIDAIDNFKDILNNCIDHPRTIMLLGNHDIHYLPPLDKEWGCRRYNFNIKEIQELFLNNLNKFKISFVIENINNKKYVFSHAGFTQGWIDQIKRIFNREITVENASELLFSEDGLTILSMVGPERGGYWRDNGSCVWADVNEHFGVSLDGIYQIFGHTLSFPDYNDFNKFDINESFAMLDSRQPFILDIKNGELKPLENLE